MRRSSAILGSVVFFAVAPGVVAGLIPWGLSEWRLQTPFPAYRIVEAAGSIVTAAGLAALIHAFMRFALEGRGTPAPVAPTAELVVGGLYRHVRNPMYVAVLAIIIGQALLFASIPVLIYAALVFGAVHAFVVGYEEPTLSLTYGALYEEYRAAVPRWLPRPTPWRGG